MKRFLVASVVLLLSCGQEDSCISIVGGEIAPHKPWYGRFEVAGGFTCGATLIDRQWVLTAAHCLKGARQMAIRLGAVDMRDGKNGGHPFELIPVIGVVRHATEDLALLKLQKPSKFAPAPYSFGSEVANGAPVVAFGFGKTARDKPVSTRLLKVGLRHIKGGNGRNNPRLIYVGAGVGKDICYGDSGGPLIHQGKLVGVAKWTSSECGKFDTSIRVSAFTRPDVQWIQNHI